VFVKGKKSIVEDGQYVTFVHRKIKDGKEEKDKKDEKDEKDESSNENKVWIKFKKNNRTICLFDDVLDCKHTPQMVIYTMLDSVPPPPENDEEEKD
jgi:hypothetical protein